MSSPGTRGLPSATALRSMAIEPAPGGGFRWRGGTPRAAVEIFHAVRRMPYASTGRRTAADLVRDGRGACTAKHLLLRELLVGAGIPAEVETVVGRFGEGLPGDISTMPEALRRIIREGGVPDYHHYVTASLDDHEVVLDATWHDALMPYGFPVNADWNGHGDTVIALQGRRIPDRPDDLAAFKARSIAGLSEADRARRAEFLALISGWIAEL